MWTKTDNYLATSYNDERLTSPVFYFYELYIIRTQKLEGYENIYVKRYEIISYES